MTASALIRVRMPALGIRALTVALALPSYLVLMWMGEAVWVGAVVWSAIIAGHEYFNLMETGGYPTNSKLGMLWIAILIVRYSGALNNIPLAVVITWGMMALLASALFSRRTPFLTWLSTAGGAMYIGSSLALLVPIRQSEAGFWWLLFLLGSTFMADTGAYLVGSVWGKRKLWPAISPKKSWEGLLGALVIGPLCGMGLAWLSMQAGPSQALLAAAQAPLLQLDWIRDITALNASFFRPLPLSWATALGLGILIGVWGQIGDLAISMWKRHVGAKDTGTLFRGHGGMLDRLDSLLFTAPLVFSFILIFGG